MGHSLSGSISVIADSSTSQTLRLTLSYVTTAGVSDTSNSLTISGNWSHSGAVSISVPYGGGTQVIYTGDITVSKTYGATQNVSWSATLTGINYWGTTASGSGSATVPARPYVAPTAPSSVTATRSSDTSISVSWTRNPSTGAPYDGQSVWVKTNDGAEVFVANVLGTATSYSFTAAANNKYQFIVKASNSAGTTASTASNVIITTPAALSSLSAALVSSGTIRLTLSVRPTPHLSSQVVIQESNDGGSTWNSKTTLAMSSLSATGTTTWDDTSARTSGTTQYRATVQTTAGTQGTLSSAVTLSNALTLNTPPNAPTNLTPSGGVDASRPIRLAWTHNASSDGAAQSSRKIEYSTDGGSTWTSIVAGNSTVAYYDWTPTLESFTAGQTIVFRVATAGSQPGTYGAWSASQSITLYGSLAVTLVTNNPPATHGGGPIPVAWTSSPTWETATQTQFRVLMTDQATGVVVYDTGMVAGVGESAEIPAAVQQNDTVYIVSVTLLSNHQIESVPVTRTVTTDYLAPGPVELLWDFDDQSGMLTFYPTFSEETSSEFDDTASWTLERSLDGSTWVAVGSMTGELPINDYLPRLNVASYYRTVTYTALGVAGEPTVVEVPAVDVQSRWAWLNWGGGNQNRVRFAWTMTDEVSVGRASETYELETASGSYPAVVFGNGLEEKHSVSTKLLFGDGMPTALASSSSDELVVLAKEADVRVLRDADGHWFPCKVTDVRVSRGRAEAGPKQAFVTFTIERTYE